MKQKKLRKGFTLVELMVVLVIIGILAGMAIPRFLGATNKTKAAEYKPVLKEIYTLQSAYKAETDSFGANAAVIGFVQPESTTRRFDYSASSSASALGTATPNARGQQIPNIDATDIGCIDEAGVIRAKTDLANISNVPAGC